MLCVLVLEHGVGLGAATQLAQVSSVTLLKCSAYACNRQQLLLATRAGRRLAWFGNSQFTLFLYIVDSGLD